MDPLTEMQAVVAPCAPAPGMSPLLCDAAPPSDLSPSELTARNHAAALTNCGGPVDAP